MDGKCMHFHQNDIYCLKTWAFLSTQLKNKHKLLKEKPHHDTTDCYRCDFIDQVENMQS